MVIADDFCPVNLNPSLSYRSPAGLTAGQLYLGRPIVARTVVEAANSCGSNQQYVRAAVVLLQAENEGLLFDVLAGRLSILEAAARVRNQSNLIQSYRAASPADRIAFARVVGAEQVLDEFLAHAAE